MILGKAKIDFADSIKLVFLDLKKKKETVWEGSRFWWQLEQTQNEMNI